MKSILTAFALLIANQIFAQQYWIEPEHPTWEDTIVVTYQVNCPVHCSLYDTTSFYTNDRFFHAKACVGYGPQQEPMSFYIQYKFKAPDNEPGLYYLLLDEGRHFSYLPPDSSCVYVPPYLLHHEIPIPICEPMVGLQDASTPEVKVVYRSENRTIQLIGTDQIGEELSVEIVDIFGRNMQLSKVSFGNFSVENLKPGPYIVRVSSKHSMKSQKILLY